MKQVAIIIPSMDNKYYLDHCLNSLLNNTPGITYHVYVVNNGERGSCDWMDHPTVTIIEAGGNRGWEGALQMGVEASEEPLVLFLNDDTVFLPKYREWLTCLVADLGDPYVGAAGPSSNYVSGPQSILHALPATRLSARFLIGFCILVRRSALDKAGGIIPGTGADDIDLSIRLRQEGYSLVCDRTTFVYHYGAKTGERVYGSVFGPEGWYSADKMARARSCLIFIHGPEAVAEVYSAEPLEEYCSPATAEGKR